jgi:hypothetical protein
MRQVLILSDKPVFQECVIKRNQNMSIQNNTNPISIVASSMVSQNSIIPDELQSNNINITISSETKVEEHDNVKPVPATPIMVSLVTKCLDTDVEKDIETDKEKDKEVKMMDEKGNRNGNEQLATQSDNINKQGTLEKDSLKQKISDFPDMMELTDADLEIKNDESVKIKPANDIYYELYRVAKEKARTARKLAFDAYLEVKKIKKTYMLDDSDSDFSNSSESEKSEDSDDSQESEDD